MVVESKNLRHNVIIYRNREYCYKPNKNIVSTGRGRKGINKAANPVNIMGYRKRIIEDVIFKGSSG